MANPLLSKPDSQNQGVDSIIDILKGKPDSAIVAFGKQLYSQNPAFRDFVNPMKGKTPQQICDEKGVDYGKIWGR